MDIRRRSTKPEKGTIETSHCDDAKKIALQSYEVHIMCNEMHLEESMHKDLRDVTY